MNFFLDKIFRLWYDVFTMKRSQKETKMTRGEYEIMIREAANAAVNFIQYWDNGPADYSWIWSHEYPLRSGKGTVFFSDRFESCWVITQEGARKFRELWELREFLKG